MLTIVLLYIVPEGDAVEHAVLVQQLYHYINKSTNEYEPYICIYIYIYMYNVHIHK